MATTPPYRPSLPVKLPSGDSENENLVIPEIKYFSKDLLKAGVIFGFCILRLQTEGKISAEEIIDYLTSET